MNACSSHALARWLRLVARRPHARVQVMMPAYDCSTYNAIFFIVFLIIGLYFLLSLVLAVTYTHFQEKTKEKVIKQLRRRVTGLTMAFNTLAGPKARFAPTHKYAPRRTSAESADSGHSRHSASEADASLLAAAEQRSDMLHRGGSRRGSFSFSAYVLGPCASCVLCSSRVPVPWPCVAPDPLLAIASSSTRQVCGGDAGGRQGVRHGQVAGVAAPHA